MRTSRRGRVALALGAVATLGVAAFLLLTRPSPLPASAIPAYSGDRARGEVLFHAGSCLTCHKAGGDAPLAARALPAGGAPFPTPIGVLYPQNLTPDPGTGLGRWSDADFVNAMRRGLSPRGEHYFPAFPYPSFAAMRTEDLLDLRAYLSSLPPVHSPTRAPEVPMLWLARRGVGLWNRLALDEKPVATDPSRGPAWNRGAYLVRDPGHCGECHTPRNWLMIMDEHRAFAGGPHPRGEGKVPSLLGLVVRERCEDASDLATALQFGEAYGYDKLSSGGMGDVQTNLSKLPEDDLAAIAEYLVSLR